MHLALSTALTLAGLGLLAFAGWVAWAGARTGSWPRAKGKVVSATIAHAGADDEESPRLDVSYIFQVGGKTYSGDRLRIGGNTVGADQISETAWYHAGREVWVAYDPADPRVNVLDPGLDESTVLRWAAPGVVCLIIGLLSLYGLI